MYPTTSDLVAKLLGVPCPEMIFPWQHDLFARFQAGRIPAALDIPTGLGKTSVMALWLAARASGAQLPRRLVYVVDRRAVVDQATDVALRLRQLVDAEPDLKAALGLSDDQSLPISTLRGRFVDNREWLADPTAPAIIVGTVDMVGSRLLFEGYGVSRKMRPYHAGLLGADTLVALDEAHLVPPFEHLLRAIATDPAFRPRDGRHRMLAPPFNLLSLSATGRAPSDERLGLTEKDCEHEVLRKRLYAKKSLRIETLGAETKLEDALAKQAWAVTEGGKKALRVIVYSNSRDVARQARETVERLARSGHKTGTPSAAIDLELFVGGRRVLEREQVKKRLEALGFIAGSRSGRSRPAFLFATSAGEVGVDLDADHMICDLVEWERMVQRLGRVNRRGDGEARITVFVEPEPKANNKEQEALDKQHRREKLDDKERKRVDEYQKRLHQWSSRKLPFEYLRKHEEGGYDASPAALLDLKTRALTDADLRKVVDEATTPEPLRPALTRPLVEAWAMTSLERHPGRPAIQPWLRGWIEDAPQTTVVWRRYLPVRTTGAAPLKSEIEAFFEAAPPHTSEHLETETFRVANWIAARGEALASLPVEQETTTLLRCLRDEDVVAFALEPDGRLRRDGVLTLGRVRSPLDNKGKEEFRRLLAGATLIVDSRLAGLKDGLLDEKEASMPQTADDGDPWLDTGAVGFRVRILDAATLGPKNGTWRERFRFAYELTDDGEATRWLVVEKWRHDAATEEDRSSANPQLLDEHQSWTEKRARHLAKDLDLDDALQDLLALAARLHDEGKRATRWQRAFNAPAGGIYAKTEGPISYGLLDGYRHELGSLLRVECDERLRHLPDEHRDLVLHLITAHHGFARPVIGTGGCEDKPPSVLQAKAAEIALRFARLQARWGPWGLAWWEALLRAADQQASRENDAGDPDGERS